MVKKLNIFNKKEEVTNHERFEEMRCYKKTEET